MAENAPFGFKNVAVGTTEIEVAAAIEGMTPVLHHMDLTPASAQIMTVEAWDTSTATTLFRSSDTTSLDDVGIIGLKGQSLRVKADGGTTSAIQCDGVYDGPGVNGQLISAWQEEITANNGIVYVVMHTPHVDTIATISGITTGNPTPITLTAAVVPGRTSFLVTITGVTGNTPATINGVHTATRTGDSSFTIPINTTVAGTGGTASFDRGTEQLVLHRTYIEAADAATQFVDIVYADDDVGLNEVSLDQVVQATNARKDMAFPVPSGKFILLKNNSTAVGARIGYAWMLAHRIQR